MNSKVLHFHPRLKIKISFSLYLQNRDISTLARFSTEKSFKQSGKLGEGGSDNTFSKRKVVE